MALKKSKKSNKDGFEYCQKCAAYRFCNHDCAKNASNDCDYFTHPASPVEHRNRMLEKLLEDEPF